MMQIVSAARATFRKELRLLLRDPFCVALLVCFSIGLAWASWNSYGYWHDFSNQQTLFQAAAREAWLSQTTDNAHMATHVGQTVYKPISPLAGFDPGAVSNFGSAIFVQSHHQAAAQNKPRQDAVELLQSEAYSPAVLLQLIGPLLIIVLGVASIAREKEGGTLSILLTTGSSWPAIVIGKGLAAQFALFIVAIPGLLMLAIPWFDSNPILPSLDLLVRVVLIFGTLLTYYIGWLGVTFLISSKSNTPSGSFSVLIALWSVFALVMPRISADVAAFAAPLPTNAEVRLEKENAVHDSNRSSIEMARARRAFESKLLKEFKVDRIEDLPIDLAGARMIAQEDSTNRLYDEIEGRITQVMNRQNELIAGFQFASPFMAMRAVSSSLSATDRKHHFDFVNAAEKHRRQFVNELNLAERNKQEIGSSPEQRRQFWAGVAEYIPSFVSAVKDVKRSIIAMTCLVVWAAVMGIASLYACPQISRAR